MPSNHFKRSCLALAVGHAIIAPTHAATITVDTHLDNGSACTLRDAIVSVNSASLQPGCVNSGGAFGTNDTIVFSGLASNTIGLAVGQLSIQANTDVLIDGSGVNDLTIDANGESRVVFIDDATVRIESLTITGGAQPAFSSGAGLIVHGESSDVYLQAVKISENEGYGIFNQSGSISIANGEISANTSRGIRSEGELYLRDSKVNENLGGGIRFSGQGYILDSEVSGNSAYRGSGIYVDGWGKSATLTVANSSISANTATDYGGGIGNNSGRVVIRNSTIVGNSARDGAGFENRGTLVADASSIHSNSATGFGGGILARGNTTSLVNSTISNNFAALRGGGVAIRNGFRNYAYNSTFSTNSAGSRGGGIYVKERESISVSNSMVSGNKAPVGGEIYSRGVITSFGYNLFGDNSQTTAQAFDGFTPNLNSIVATSNGNTPTALSNILSPLADNGGDTLTHALPNGSPALDSANGAICTSAPVDSVDQRGATRGDICDIGAFESSVITVNSSSDTSGGIECTLRDAILASNSQTSSGGCGPGTGSMDEVIFSNVSSITLSSALPTITSDMSLNGGSGVHINGAGNGRVFTIDGAAVNLNALGITGGNNSGVAALNNADVSITRSTLWGNSSPANGGGVFADSSQVQFSNSTLSGNQAGADGGGVFATNLSAISLNNSTLSNNTASANGGAIAAGSSSVTLTNSLIAGNRATNGGEVENVSNSASFFTLGVNLFGDDARSNLQAFRNFAPSLNDITATSDGNLPFSLNSIIAPLATSGGSSLVHELVEDSPAIDAADDGVCPGADQRGRTRKGSTCDIGAFEFDGDKLFIVPLKNGGSVVFGL